MNLRDLYRPNQFGLSLEIFPPKTPEGDEGLRQTLRELAVYRPGFISCTYGAGGSTQARTLDWCEEIQTKHGIPATAHFTCVGSTREQLVDWLRQAHGRGVRNIMALRGDAPAGQEGFQAVDGGLAHASDLVKLIRTEFPDMGVGVAGYPEKHPEAESFEQDLNHLVHKVVQGANAIFTQLFFDNDSFYYFWERCLERGVTVPVVPGIMPITEFARIKRITAMCGSRVPDELARQLEAVQDDKEAQQAIGVEYAIKQCQDLIEHGVPGIHFYILNKSHAGLQILEALGLTAEANRA